MFNSTYSNLLIDIEFFKVPNSNPFIDYLIKSKNGTCIKKTQS